MFNTCTGAPASHVSMLNEKEIWVAEFTVIKETEAPRPARQTGRLAARMREYEKYLESVSPGKAGKLVPARGESPRGIALRVSRAGKRMNKTVNTWVTDGVVYFTVV